MNRLFSRSQCIICIINVAFLIVMFKLHLYVCLYVWWPFVYIPTICLSALQKKIPHKQNKTKTKKKQPRPNIICNEFENLIIPSERNLPVE